jgi:hypothetical protein
VDNEPGRHGASRDGDTQMNARMHRGVRTFVAA